jgi:DNA-binding protein HU-beta
MTKLMSKSELIQKIAGQLTDKVTRDDVKEMLDALTDVGHEELRTTGAFLLPGFAKFVVVEKAATQAHEGVNPFTKEKMIVAAKPASKAVRARPVKAAKDAVS